MSAFENKYIFYKIHFLSTYFENYRMNVQAVADMKELYHHKDERLQRRDLMRLTWTTKHRWFGQSSARKTSRYKRSTAQINGNRYLLKGPTRERPYL